jgi:hypothetical protein
LDLLAAFRFFKVQHLMLVWLHLLLQIDGSALGQHMEDFYLATLKEAVLAADPALAGKVEKALKKAAAAATSATSAATEASANADEAGKSA